MKRKIRTRRRDLAVIRAGIAHFLCITLLLAICHASSNEESSEDTDGSQSQDYDDDQTQEYDDTVNQDTTWYADDPYYPTDIDDYIIQEMNAESDAELNAMNNENESPMNMHELLIRVMAGTISVLGLAADIFCTAIFLYFLRVDGLMRRYAREGMPVDGRILASVPDIQEEVKEYKTEEKALADKIQNNDSYSMMTDDESYQISRSEYSGSDRSGENEIEEGQKSGNIEDRERRPSVISGISSVQTSKVKSRQQQVPKENTKISAGKRKFHSTSFRVIVEYDDITYHDIISQESSEMIRKRILVMGEDIIVETNTKNSSSLLVKLHVLQNQPMSGHPCGEVRRALRWQKRLTFNVYIVFGIALVVGGAIVAKHILSSKFFLVYIGLLILQVPILNCFLNGSFSKIISDRYLENGLSLPSTTSKKGLDDKEKMISALKHGTSFGFL